MSRRTITLEQWTAECAAAPKPVRVICPACGTKQGRAEFDAAGVPKETQDKTLGFSCIGRFTGQGDKGITAKYAGRAWDKGCNWTLGGLLHIHELEIVTPDGQKHPHFELVKEP